MKDCKDNKDDISFSSKFSCTECDYSISELEPRLFSFNNPFGACPVCDGLGTQMYFDPNLIVPDPSLSPNQNAILPWATSTSKYYLQTLESLADHFKFDLDQAWKNLSKKHQQIFQKPIGLMVNS